MAFPNFLWNCVIKRQNDLPYNRLRARIRLGQYLYCIPLKKRHMMKEKWLTPKTASWLPSAILSEHNRLRVCLTWISKCNVCFWQWGTCHCGKHKLINVNFAVQVLERGRIAEGRVIREWGGDIWRWRAICIHSLAWLQNKVVGMSFTFTYLLIMWPVANYSWIGDRGREEEELSVG